MEQLVYSRITDGLFASIDDFANRIDPAAINRRSLENLASAGAFEGLEPNRSAVCTAADMILATAQSARDTRDSGQGGLFGGDDGDGDMAKLRLATETDWGIGERMAQEKDAFGFYFSAHPCNQFAQLAASYGARSFSDWMASGPIAEGVRKPATLAAMVENVRWRESRKGKRFALAEFSDSSGQFSASCFDEATAQLLMDWAKESACLLLNVEMDMRAGDETPRLAVRSAKPLSALVAVARLKMQLDIAKPEAFDALAAMVNPLIGGKCELVINTRSANNKPVQIMLGRQYLLDASLIDKLQTIDGINNVALAPLGAPRMQLV